VNLVGKSLEEDGANPKTILVFTGRGDAMYEYEVALATPKYIFYLNKLVYLIISYPKQCDFATTIYFTCLFKNNNNYFTYQKLIEIRKLMIFTCMIDVLHSILSLQIS